MRKNKVRYLFYQRLPVEGAAPALYSLLEVRIGYDTLWFYRETVGDKTVRTETYTNLELTQPEVIRYAVKTSEASHNRRLANAENG